MVERLAVNPPPPRVLFLDPAPTRRGFGVSGVLLSWAILAFNAVGNWLASRQQKRDTPGVKPEKVEPFDLFSRCNDRYARAESVEEVARKTVVHRPPRPRAAKTLEDYMRQASGSREADYHSRRTKGFTDVEEEAS